MTSDSRSRAALQCCRVGARDSDVAVCPGHMPTDPEGCVSHLVPPTRVFARLSVRSGRSGGAAHGSSSAYFPSGPEPRWGMSMRGRPANVGEAVKHPSGPSSNSDRRRSRMVTACDSHVGHDHDALRPRPRIPRPPRHRQRLHLQGRDAIFGPRFFLELIKRRRVEPRHVRHVVTCSGFGCCRVRMPAITPITTKAITTPATVAPSRSQPAS